MASLPMKELGGQASLVTDLASLENQVLAQRAIKLS